MTSCYENIIIDNQQNSSSEEGLIRINGIIAVNNLLQTANMTIESLIDESPLKTNRFSLEVMSNDYPQLLYVSNENNDIIMMSRGYTQEELGTINAKSTALAFASLYPLFIPRSKEEYYTTINILESSSYFSAYLKEVENSIYQKQDIFNTENTDLLIAFSNLLEDVCATSTAFSPTKATVEGIPNDPLHIEKNGSKLIVRNRGFRPTYECIVLHGGRDIPEFNKLILANSSYGFLELIQGFDPNERLGIPQTFELNDEGEYEFYFSCRTERALKDLKERNLIDALSMGGFDNSRLDLSYKLLLTDVDPTSDLSNYLNTIGSALQTDGITRLSSKLGNLLKKITMPYNIIKGTGNEFARIAWGLQASDIQFCICSYNGDLTSCTQTTLTPVTNTNNQSGFPNQQLLLPIQVLVSSLAGDETYIQSSYHKVKFEVVSGGGFITDRIAATDENGFAETYWTLGNEGEQKVKAVAIDLVTGVEVSDPVFFKATLRNNADLTIRLSWHKLSGDTDIDLHVTDPYGEEIAFYNMTSASGGWLDRDDVIGPGPEHICWTNAPKGDYQIQVHYYDSDCHNITSYEVTIYAGNKSFGPYKGSISYDKLVSICTITMPDAIVSYPSSIPAMMKSIEFEGFKEFYPPKKK